jgi:hypothetical protein
MTTAVKSHWTQKCRELKRSQFVKRAVGEMGSDTSFEGAFSNLAHSYLQDKAPGLLPFELGFQLLEKNEDNDKAVGVFGFQIGNQLIYAPVFFLNGELKGHELMYLKDSDSFVPLQENWVNYIVNRKPNVIGDETTTNMRAIGVERPSMDLVREPMRKYSMDADMAAGMPGLMHAVSPQIAAAYSKDFTPVVPELIKTSAAAAMSLLRIVDAYPRLVAPLVRCYGKEMFKSAMDAAQTLASAMPLRPSARPRQRIITGSILKEKTAAETIREENPLNTGKLMLVMDSPGSPAPPLLSKQAVDTLKREGIYVEDNREDASRIYRVQPPLTLNTPDQTGCYDVLVHPDKFEECIVLMNNHGKCGRGPGCVVLDREGSAGSIRYCSDHPGNVFAAVKDDEDYREWFDELPEADTLERGATYVLVTPAGASTQIFEVETTQPAEGDEKCYGVWWRDSYSMRRPDHLPPMADNYYDSMPGKFPGSDRAYSEIELISLKRIKGPKIKSLLRTMYMPPGTKAVKLKNARKRDYEPIMEDSQSDPPPLRIGSSVDLQLGIHKISSELKVMNDGIEAIVNDRRMPIKAALSHRIGTHGLREKAARDLLQEAEKGRGCRVRIKYAAPYDLISSAPSAPAMPEPQIGQDSFMNSQVPMQQYQEMDIPAPMYQLQNTDDTYNAARPPDPQVMQQVQDAAATGQQEVLDTSMLSSLLRNSRDDTLIDRHLGDLIKGLDRIGRLLFNFYWHNDKFADRFGDSEMPELEDALRNSFEGVGDLVLFLKQKSIDPYPEEATDVDLGPQAEVT